MIPALVLALLLQGIPVRPQNSGTVTGTVRNSEGKPAVGIRVAARPLSNNLLADSGETIMASLGETDADGHYRLENILPGRYTISAGRVDFPTYYPGTPDSFRATVITIAAGTTTSDIDFTLGDSSFMMTGQTYDGLFLQRPVVPIPIVVRNDDSNGKVPVFAYGNFVRLGSPTSSVSLGESSILLPVPTTPTAYPLKVENLPQGFTVKTMTYGTTDLLKNPLRLSSSNLPPASTITITLGSSDATPSAPGVRVAGQLKGPPGIRGIYLSGVAGILYADGTFEFRGVPPGRHVIATGYSNALAASVIVGDADVEGIELEPIALLPGAGFPASVPDKRAPGTVIPFATIRGRIVSEATGQPLSTILQVKGWAQVAYPVGIDGKFEISKLVPGTYVLQASPFDHYTVNETVVVGEEDVNVELRVKRVY